MSQMCLTLSRHRSALLKEKSGIACILGVKHVEFKSFVESQPKLIALYFLLTENKSKPVWDHADLDAIRG